jgi:pimeloyl-ACP methyl ester carboxylesterase
MKFPVWLSPALYGAAGGALALAIVGFSWGGWVTGSTAMKMSDKAVETAVVSSLTPYCLAQSQRDPNATQVLADLEAAKSYNRRDIVEKAGWATPLGEEKPNRDLAVACVKALTNS